MIGKSLIKLLLVLGVVAVFSTDVFGDTPLYRTQDPSADYNFLDIFHKLSTHKHDGGSSDYLDGVIPSTGSAYSVGGALKRYATGYFDVIVFANGDTIAAGFASISGETLYTFVNNQTRVAISSLNFNGSHFIRETSGSSATLSINLSSITASGNINWALLAIRESTSSYGLFLTTAQSKINGFVAFLSTGQPIIDGLSISTQSYGLFLTTAQSKINEFTSFLATGQPFLDGLSVSTKSYGIFLTTAQFKINEFTVFLATGQPILDGLSVSTQSYGLFLATAQARISEFTAYLATGQPRLDGVSLSTSANFIHILSTYNWANNQFSSISSSTNSLISAINSSAALNSAQFSFAFSSISSLQTNISNLHSSTASLLQIINSSAAYVSVKLEEIAIATSSFSPSSTYFVMNQYDGVQIASFSVQEGSFHVGRGTFVYLSSNIYTHAISGDASDGLYIQANNLTKVGLLGVGNSANVTWYGTNNFDGGNGISIHGVNFNNFASTTATQIIFLKSSGTLFSQEILNLHNSTSNLISVIKDTAAYASQQISLSFSSISAIQTSTQNLLSLLKDTASLTSSQFSTVLIATTSLFGGGTYYIRNQSSDIQVASFSVISGSITDAYITRIVWPDGTIQVSSPIVSVEGSGNDEGFSIFKTTAEPILDAISISTSNLTLNASNTNYLTVLGSTQTKLGSISLMGRLGLNTETPSSRADIVSGSITVRGVGAGLNIEGLIEASDNKVNLLGGRESWGLYYNNTVPVVLISSNASTITTLMINNSTQPSVSGMSLKGTRLQFGNNTLTLPSYIFRNNFNNEWQFFNYGTYTFLSRDGGQFSFQNFETGAPIRYLFNISSVAYVGVNIATPTHRFEIQNGSISVNRGNLIVKSLQGSSDGIIVSGSTGTSANRLSIRPHGNSSVALQRLQSGGQIFFQGSDGVREHSIGSNGNWSMGTQDGNAKLNVGGNVAVGSNYYIESGIPTNGLAVEGRVGIGTTTPSVELQIEGNAPEINLNATGATSNVIQRWKQAGTEKGAVFYYHTDGNFLMRAGSGNKLGLNVNGSITPSLLIDTSGNVGIGTTNPSQKLDVVGTAKATTFEGTLNGTLLYEDNRTISPSELDANRLKFGFTSYTNNDNGPWADFLHMRSYTDSSGGSDNLLTFNKSAIAMRLYQQTYGSTNPYTTYKDVVLAENSPSANYIPKYSGTGTNVSVTGSVIYDNGYVGISNTNPTRKLSVVYPQDVGGLELYSSDYDTDDLNAGIEFNSGTNTGPQGAMVLYHSGVSGYEGLSIYGYPNDGSPGCCNNSVVFRTNGDTYFPNDVGIGINSPESRLDTLTASAQSAISGGAFTYGSEAADLILTRLHSATNNSGYGYAGPLIDLRGRNAGGQEASLAQILGVIDPNSSAGNWSGGLAFLTSPGGTTDPSGRRSYGAAPITRMLIDHNGKVGVGISSPAAQMHVGESIAIGPNYLGTAGSWPFFMNRFFAGMYVRSESTDDLYEPRLALFSATAGSGAMLRSRNSGGFSVVPVSDSSTSPWIAVTPSTFESRVRFNVGGTTASVTISSHGVVGIGNLNPKWQVEIGTGATKTDGSGFQLRTFSNGSTWDGGIASGDNHSSVVLGSLFDLAQIGGHNGVLGAWANLYINGGGGSVAIGKMTTPGDVLDVNGDARVGTGTTGCLKDADGTTIAGTCSSDARFKTVVGTMPLILPQLTALEPKYYFWKSTEYPDQHWGDEKQLGLVAQEVEEYIPELVFTDEEGYKKVRYEMLSMYLLKGLKEAYVEIESLKQRVQILEGN